MHSSSHLCDTLEDIITCIYDFHHKEVDLDCYGLQQKNLEQYEEEHIRHRQKQKAYVKKNLEIERLLHTLHKNSTSWEQWSKEQCNLIEEWASCHVEWMIYENYVKRYKKCKKERLENIRKEISETNEYKNDEDDYPSRSVVVEIPRVDWRPPLRAFLNLGLPFLPQHLIEVIMNYIKF